MSWSRFATGSDVYTFPSERGGVGTLECCWCSLMPAGDSFYTVALDPFLVHLDHHAAAGHVLPAGLAELIAAEADEYLTTSLSGDTTDTEGRDG